MHPRNITFTHSVHTVQHMCFVSAVASQSRGGSRYFFSKNINIRGVFFMRLCNIWADTLRSSAVKICDLPGEIETVAK